MVLLYQEDNERKITAGRGGNAENIPKAKGMDAQVPPFFDQGYRRRGGGNRTSGRATFP